MNENTEYYVLYRHHGLILAADASQTVNDEFPELLFLDAREFRLFRDEDTFVFWDELVDDTNSVVGYTFDLPESPVFRSSRFLRESENVVVEKEQARIELRRGIASEVACVQGFGSEVYQASDDPYECALLMFNWSDRECEFRLEGEVLT